MKVILDLWNTKRWLFWLLLPIVIIAFGLKFFMGNQSEKGLEDIKKAEELDCDLKKQQDDTNNNANQLKSESNQLENQINTNNVDENWYLKNK
jgi:uncharacterized protein YlxW (UPF0749 family)